MRHSTKNAFILFTNLLLLTCLISCKQIPYGANKATGKYYNIRGFKMYCEIYGTGKPLLMIHGNDGSISTFSGLIPHFADEYKVIVADSRAQGKSTDSKDSLSYEMMADDFAALLDQMHIDSAYVIGWSDGGVNAILMALRHPEKIKKMAISGAILKPDPTIVDPAEWTEGITKYNRLKTISSKTNQQMHDWKLIRLEIDEKPISLNALQSIQCPTLVIGGDHDIINPKHTRLIQQNIPNSRLWIVPNSGHGTLFEHRRKFINKVDVFFDQQVN
ncbi:MAG: alpha/beta hydrolase [Bacteroidota bacterium]